jgi:nucleotide-binding universal stress UspA family protein
MKNILVPVGTSKNVKNHLQYAIDFAKAVGARLYVVQVYNVYTKAGTMIKVDYILERESNDYLTGLLNEVDTKGVDIVKRVLKGKLINTLELACKKGEIDLMLIEPRTTSVKTEVFLGKTSGQIIKRTQIPTLIVPEGAVFKPITRILMAVKSAIIRKEGVLNPLKDIQNNFNSLISLLLVKTPYYNDGDFDVKEELSGIVNNTTETENATTFQGVLEHYKTNDPDMLCVVRRKRGFFMKKWEKNVIKKRDFHSPIPVLVLRGMK